jgi:uncharacterized repeat protein (TIGR01451 family)
MLRSKIYFLGMRLVTLWFRRIAAVFAIAILTGAASPEVQPAQVQQTAAIETTLVAQVRSESASSSGRTAARFAPALALREGQELFYTVRILNPSAEFAREVVVVQGIPKNTTYVPYSAAGPGAIVTFSADGGKSYAAEGQLHVTDAAGVSRQALPQDYTHIRWQLHNPLAPGAVALARFRAIFR